MVKHFKNLGPKNVISHWVLQISCIGSCSGDDHMSYVSNQDQICFSMFLLRDTAMIVDLLEVVEEAIMYASPPHFEGEMGISFSQFPRSSLCVHFKARPVQM